MRPMSEAAEVHKTSFSTEVPTNTYYTYLFDLSSMVIVIGLSLAAQSYSSWNVYDIYVCLFALE